MNKNTDDNESLVDFDLIREMLYDEDAYVKEFSEASIQSFTEFRDQFKINLDENNLDGLRKAGHKIKPIAQMLHLNKLLELYEEGKSVLIENKSDSKKSKLIAQVDDYCAKLVLEFGEYI